MPPSRGSAIVDLYPRLGIEYVRNGMGVQGCDIIGSDDSDIFGNLRDRLRVAGAVYCSPEDISRVRISSFSSHLP